jgi:hypothetical protein
VPYGAVNGAIFQAVEAVAWTRFHRFVTITIGTDTLVPAERTELTELRIEADRFMLRKAQAAAILRWRGHLLPPPERL